MRDRLAPASQLIADLCPTYCDVLRCLQGTEELEQCDVERSFVLFLVERLQRMTERSRVGQIYSIAKANDFEELVEGDFLVGRDILMRSE